MTRKFSILALLSTICVAVSAYAVQTNDCLEMFCPYGCKITKGKGKCCSRHLPITQRCDREEKDAAGCVTVEKINCETDEYCHTDGRCYPKYCTNNKDCPENEACVRGDCVPCNQEGTGLRALTEDSCHCPKGQSKLCGSTSTTLNCLDGGNWVCCLDKCGDNTDCPADQYCSCSGNGCTKSNGCPNGTCVRCPPGTHRSHKAATACVACGSCERWDAITEQCVNACGEDEICAPKTGGRVQNCGGYQCLSVPKERDLVRLSGTLNDKMYYLPPVGKQYQFTHTAASLFCEHYGMHLANITEACMKDYAYDSGHDCPNIVQSSGANRQFTDRGRSYRIYEWAVDSNGSFWLANLDSTGEYAIRVTHSCGNNHESYICNGFYPICTNE